MVTNNPRFKDCPIQICMAPLAVRPLQRFWSFTDSWWHVVPTPLRLKYLRGSVGLPMDSDARGFPLESNFAQTLLHYTYMKELPSITKWGIRAGINCGKSAGNCVHLSADHYDAEHYMYCAKQLAQGDLTLPTVVGFPPKPEQNAEVIVNFDRLYATNPELCQDEGFSITCKALYDIPWHCLEAAICRDTMILVWVNQEFYDKYLVVPNAVNIFGTGASSSSSAAPTFANPVDAREETPSGSLAACIDDLFKSMTISMHCAMCMNCFRKEQVGTIWCYSCGTPMTMQERLPISPEHIALMVQDSSDKLMAKLGLRIRTTDPTDARRVRGAKKRIFDGLTWSQRMRTWRKGAYKKKGSSYT